MHVGRAEPEAERPVLRARGQEVIEVLADLVVQGLLGRLEGRPIGDHPRDVLRELVEPPAGLLVGVFPRAVRCIGGRAGAPHLVHLADVIAGIAEHQRVRGLGAVPDGAEQDGTATGPPEMLARQEGAAARGAARGGDERPAEQDPFPGHPIEVGRPHRVVDRAGSVELGIRPGVPPPVVGEREEDVRPLRIRRPQRSRARQADPQPQAQGPLHVRTLPGWRRDDSSSPRVRGSDCRVSGSQLRCIPESRTA